MDEAGSTRGWGWEPFIEAHQWDDVTDWWMRSYFDNPDEPAPLRALLAALLELVPKVQEENRMELRERHLTARDDPKHWRGQEHLKGAAAILDLGELQAAIERYPPEASEAWRKNRKIIEAFLDEFLEGQEVTEGAKDLSRKAHAREARDLLRYTDDVTATLSCEMDSEEDRDWLQEGFAEIANLAFEAGRRTQAAWGKDFEKFAVLHTNQIKRFAHDNEGRDSHNARKTAQREAWIAHATVVERTVSRDLSDSAKADFILKNWNKAGMESQRPSPPSKKTLQNWLSHRKKCPAHIGVREN